MKAAVIVAVLVAFAFSPTLRGLAAGLSPDRIQALLERAGSFAPLAHMGLVGLAVVVAPIPTLPLDVAGGAFFGPWLGTLYTALGALAGALASFGIARLFGRELIEPLLGGHVNFCSECSDKLLTRVVFASRLIPFVSFDLVSYGAGLTKMSARRFALATFFGMLPLTAAYTTLGSSLVVGPGVTLALGAAMVLLFFLLPRWIERNDLFGMRRHFEH